MTPPPTPTTLYLLTLNCARLPQPPLHLATSLTPTLPASPPHLLLTSFQELAPISPAFIAGKHLSPYTLPLREALVLATTRRYGTAYTHLATHTVGMTGVMVWCHPGVHCSSVAVAGTGVGFAGHLANKGSAAVRVHVNGRAVTVVGAHLAPDEYGAERRDRDWLDVVRRTVFVRQEAVPGEAGEREPLLQNTQAVESQLYPATTADKDGCLFVLGDLNYRTAEKRPPSGVVEGLAAPHAGFEEFAELWERDQLSLRMAEGRTMQGLAEAPVRFPPSYKRVGEGWAGNRWPSWTDRVLYLPARGVVVKEYGSVGEYDGSDHRPVYAVVEVEDGDGGREMEDVKAPVGIDPWWREKRKVARWVEWGVGYGWIVARSYVAWAVLLTVGVWVMFGIVGRQTG